MKLEVGRKKAEGRTFRILHLGRMDYREALKIQQKTHSEVLNGADDSVIFVEHPPVYTLGKNATEENLLVQKLDADMIQTDRGGDITFHGFGQIVVYPIFNLRGKSVREFVHFLEKIVIQTLAKFKIIAHRHEKYPGVWVGNEKICAIGLQIKNRVSMHGLALNVNTDLSYFEHIVPCGISGFGVTSMAKILGRKIEIGAVVNQIKSKFEIIFR